MEWSRLTLLPWHMRKDLGQWMDDFVPENSRKSASLNLCYGISIPRASVVRSRGSFPPIRLVGSNKSCLRACISLYAKRLNLRLLLQYGTNFKYLILRELKFTVLSPDIPGDYGVEDHDKKYSVTDLVIPVDPRRHCGPQSNLNLVKHV